MKNSGLKNRFSEETRNVWLWWYDCMVCGKNQISALHHIVSPSISKYIDGKHNTSVLNSCPIHNFKCHIGNEAWLGHNVGYLLGKTYEALVEIGYYFKEIDREFISKYIGLYPEHLQEALQDV